MLCDVMTYYTKCLNMYEMLCVFVNVASYNDRNGYLPILVVVPSVIYYNHNG